ncbi:MAG: site-2 protease family protein [Prosthecobacter sp.]|nr:site-2 protease family protein [Prosthecobacter sp.]
MLQFRLLGFPVFIHWTFWVVVALLGGATTADTPFEMQRLVGWMLVALVSLLIHELGHALTMRRFGDPRVIITLHSFGGLAVGSRRLSRKQDILVSAAGPFVQIAVGVALLALLKVWRAESWWVNYVLQQFVFISIVWAVLNLLPIVPLDGGRISLAMFGPRREKVALVLSLVCAVAVGIYAYVSEFYFSLVILGMLAFNNWKRMKGQPENPWMGTH